MQKIRLGISGCLLGQAVRYDGGHRLAAALVAGLTPIVELVPVCPEWEAGLGVPREVMRLEGDPARPRLLTIHTRLDRTEILLAWAARRLVELRAANLAGFIFKARSPSCGIGSVAIHQAGAPGPATASGLFADLFMAGFPDLPVADEGIVNRPQDFAAFVAQLQAIRSGLLPA